MYLYSLPPGGTPSPPPAPVSVKLPPPPRRDPPSPPGGGQTWAEGPLPRYCHEPRVEQRAILYLYDGS
jgi:hypothetical protein